MMNSILLQRTNSQSSDFQFLVKELDKELHVRDGNDHAFFAQFNKIDNIKYVIVAYENGTPVGCGAIKEYEANVAEVKRMFVALEQRGKGFASLILRDLEKWAKELGYEKCILETGYNQPEAIALYKKNSYKIIANYGQYENVALSICFGKDV